MRHLLLGLLAVLAISSPARAGGIELATGVGGWGSAWRGDAGPRSWLVVGYRPTAALAIEASGSLGYGPVDRRALVGVGLGASVSAPTGLLRPVARLTLVHAHEEPREAVEANVLEALLGVGDGIRHRAGVEASVGLGVEVARLRSTPLLLGLDARAMVFPDDRGPRWYAGGSLWAALEFDLGGKP